MELLASAYVALLLLLTPAAAENTFTVNGATIRVLFPPGFRTSTFDMAMADFGQPLYGGTLIGKLAYPSEDAAFNPTGKPMRCQDRACQYGCDPFSAAKPPFALVKKPGQFNIMLLDRGPPGGSSDSPCYFLSKAYNAQQAGADAVLIADDTDGDLTTAIVPDEEAVAHLLVNLTVSVALITRRDATQLKNMLKDQAVVTLSLNWTNVEPRKIQVSWELWTTTNDQCGTLCEEQKAFLSSMKSMSRAMEQANQTIFAPHYVFWSCPWEYQDTIDCQNECIMNGTYCAPDPDGRQDKGYSGADVLAMNVRNLCFWRVAKEAGSPWMWWDYAERFSSNCSSAAQKYTAECAKEAFTAVNGPLLLGGQGTTKWEECIAKGSPPPPGSTVTTLPLIEEELALQQGAADVAAVSILPTIRINNRQFRGTFDTKNVMRALCAAFPLDQEPAACNERSVSVNECDPAGIGSKNCRVGDAATEGRTRCINTFSGYRCQCGQGWVRSLKADSNEEVCEDLNECLATNVAMTDPNCGCTRCACVNLLGGYKCTGALPDKCTAAYNYGGCWKETVEGQQLHACQDNIEDYRRVAARGAITDKDDWFKCTCPACFESLGGELKNPTCSAKCPLAQCKNGVCANPDSGGGGGASGGGSSSSGGMSAGGVFFLLVITVAVTLGGLYAVYHYVLRKRMEGEIRDIMSQYMPLDARGANNRGGSGSRGGTRLASVDEGVEAEDAPLMGGSGGLTGGRQQGAAASGSGQRTQLGNLAAPRQGTASSAAAKPAGGYQPPAPVPEDDPDVSGLLPPTRSAGGFGPPREEAKPIAPLGDAPLLGDGPL